MRIEKFENAFGFDFSKETRTSLLDKTSHHLENQFETFALIGARRNEKDNGRFERISKWHVLKGKGILQTGSQRAITP